MHEGYHMEEKEAYTNSETQGVLNGVMFFLKYRTLTPKNMLQQKTYFKKIK